MKTTFKLSVITISLLFLFAFKYDGTNWTSFSDNKNAKFEILFPSKPIIDKKSKTNLFFSATMDEPLTTFYVKVSINETSYTEQSFRDQIKKEISNIESTYSTSVKEINEMQFNGGLCMEYQCEMMGLKSLVRAFYKDNKLFELTCNPIVGDVPEAEKDKFFNSFQYLP